MIQNPHFQKLMELGDSPDTNFLELARRYQALFQADPLVLEDLKRKFWGYDSTADDRWTELNEGNRQVILFIQKMLEVDTAPVIDPDNNDSEN